MTPESEKLQPEPETTDQSKSSVCLTERDEEVKTIRGSDEQTDG
jgi:hypothetical protein